jgi:hypothetical protein
VPVADKAVQFRLYGWLGDFSEITFLAYMHGHQSTDIFGHGMTRDSLRLHSIFV